MRPEPTARTHVTTWYLEMLDPDQLRAVECPRADVHIERAAIASPELSRFLYTAVGGNWYWTDRLGWDYARWFGYLERINTWVLHVAGTPGGYVELEAQPGDNVEIASFGLLPGFIGQRLGGYLLTVGIQRAWEQGARRVWVHTGSLDGPAALANYQARGLTVFDRRTEWQELPTAPLGPWPGARVVLPAV